jgi:hypothetical protein
MYTHHSPKLIIINNLFSKTILLTIAQTLLYHFTHKTMERAIQFSLKTYFSAPSLSVLFRTKDDITSADPLPAAHMKNKNMAVTYSFIQSTYSSRLYIITLYPSPTHSDIIHLRFCFASHFSLQLYFCFTLPHFPFLALRLHLTHFQHTAQPLLIFCCSLLYILLFT